MSYHVQDDAAGPAMHRHNSHREQITRQQQDTGAKVILESLDEAKKRSKKKRLTSIYKVPSINVQIKYLHRLPIYLTNNTHTDEWPNRADTEKSHSFFHDIL